MNSPLGWKKSVKNGEMKIRRIPKEGLALVQIGPKASFCLSSVAPFDSVSVAFGESETPEVDLRSP